MDNSNLPMTQGNKGLLDGLSGGINDIMGDNSMIEELFRPSVPKGEDGLLIMDDLMRKTDIPSGMTLPLMKMAALARAMSCPYVFQICLDYMNLRVSSMRKGRGEVVSIYKGQMSGKSDEFGDII
jgi:hypothetical protein